MLVSSLRSASTLNACFVTNAQLFLFVYTWFLLNVTSISWNLLWFINKITVEIPVDLYNSKHYKLLVYYSDRANIEQRLQIIAVYIHA